MAEEVERYQLMRGDLEQGLQTLRERVLTRTPGESFAIDDSIVGAHHVPRSNRLFHFAIFEQRCAVFNLPTAKSTVFPVGNLKTCFWSFMTQKRK